MNVEQHANQVVFWKEGTNRELHATLRVNEFGVVYFECVWRDWNGPQFGSKIVKEKRVSLRIANRLEDMALDWVEEGKL